MAGENFVPSQSGGMALLRAILGIRLFESTRRGRSHALAIITLISKLSTMELDDLHMIWYGYCYANFTWMISITHLIKLLADITSERVQQHGFICIILIQWDAKISRQTNFHNLRVRVP